MALPRIWLITMPDDPRGPVDPMEHAIEGSAPGAVGVQLRAKRSSDRELLAWGRALRSVTRRHDVPLLVNGRVDLALLVDADGVHLPERHLGVDAARSMSPKPLLVGVSCHDRAGLQRAQAEGADFAFLSPVLDVPEKGSPLGFEGFRSAIDGVGIPTYALGGIQPAHVQPAIFSGAEGIAIRRPVYSDHPRGAVQAYLHELDKSAQSGA